MRRQELLENDSDDSLQKIKALGYIFKCEFVVLICVGKLEFVLQGTRCLR